MTTKQKFGVGVLIATTRKDALGNALAVPMSYRIGILQDISTDFSFESKTLHGPGQLPIDVGRGKAKLAFSAKTADINAAALAALHFGVTPTTGFKGPVLDEPHPIPATGPYTIVIAPPSTGTFVDDLGVTYATGGPLTRVATAPATGQYSETGGTYTFAAADEGMSVLISYEYSSTTASGISPCRMRSITSSLDTGPRSRSSFSLPCADSM